jgi:hypothetical protein
MPNSFEQGITVMTATNIYFHDIAKQAKILAKQNEQTDWAKVSLNVFLIPATFGSFWLDTTDNSKAKEQAMPDDWLQAVASLPNVSKSGLNHLAKVLTKKGFISVQDAMDFVEIERRDMAEERKKNAGKGKEQQQAMGAAMLLARAEKDLPGTIDRFVEGTKDIVQAASGAAAFATEKAVWLGKGLGAIAASMKDIRGS